MAGDYGGVVALPITLTARQLELLRAARDREAPGLPLETYVARAFAAEAACVRAEPGVDERAGDAERCVVRQGEAVCVELRAGDVLRVEQTRGGQCADVLLWGAQDPTERFSAALTRSREGASPGRGASLWSAWPHERPLAEIVEDTAPGHDLLHPACTPGEYVRVGAAGEPACSLVQAAAAATWGVAAADLPEPLNLWFRPLLAADGTLGWEPRATGPGDRLELRAHTDLRAVVNPCVDDLLGCSVEPGGSIAVAHVVCGGEPAAPRVVGSAVVTHQLDLTIDDQASAAVVRAAAVRHALRHATAAGGADRGHAR